MLWIRLVPKRHLAAGSAVSASEMSAAAVTAVASLLAGPHGLLLRKCDYAFDLLPFALANLLDLLSLLLYRER